MEHECCFSKMTLWPVKLISIKSNSLYWTFNTKQCAWSVFFHSVVSEIALYYTTLIPWAPCFSCLFIENVISFVPISSFSTVHWFLWLLFFNLSIYCSHLSRIRSCISWTPTELLSFSFFFLCNVINFRKLVLIAAT